MDEGADKNELTEPHMDGTIKSFVLVQYCIRLGEQFMSATALQRRWLQLVKTYDIEASETLMRGRSKSSLRRELSSFRRRSLRSAMDCFLFFTSPCDLIS